MSLRARFITAAAVCALVAGAAATAPAAAAGGQLIKVNTCQPQQNVSAMPLGGPGFVPGFYPRGPYYWNSVYGYNYYQPAVSVNTSGTLKIDYVNVTAEVMDTIEFGLIANGRLVAEVRDVGTFSPGAEIKHEFGLNPNVFPLSTALPQCVPLKITYKNGTHWKNPHLPALRRQLYVGQ